MGLYWLFVIGSALVVSRGAGVLHKMWGSLLGLKRPGFRSAY